MSLSNTVKTPVVNWGKSLNTRYHHIQDMIRERAYENFQNRESHEGDSLTDWLHAQSQLLKDVTPKLKNQKKNIVVECDVTGFSQEEIEIELRGTQLTVFGSHEESSSEESDGVSESNSETVLFCNTLDLPAVVDPAKVLVKLHKNGKLKLTLPKKTPTKTS